MPQTTQAPSAPTPAPSRPSPATLQAAFDASLFYTLTTWAPLSVAVQNSWAGSATLDKRDWFVGAISTLFDERPETDALDLEEVMLQVMADEFDVEVQDESQIRIAERIMEIRNRIIGEGDLGVADRVREEWEMRSGVRVRMVDGGEREEEGSSGEEEVDGDGDEVMGDAEEVREIKIREKVEPEIDEDGFTKVVSKKRR